MERPEVDKVVMEHRFFSCIQTFTNTRNHKDMEESQRTPDIKPSNQRLEEIPRRQVNRGSTGEQVSGEH